MSAASGSLRGRVIASAAAVIFAAAAMLLYFVPPGEGTFYPRCTFHTMTGLHCPGCGATRCLAALVHGEFRQAMAYNVYLVLLLPFLAYAGVRAWIEGVTGCTLSRFHVPAWS